MTEVILVNGICAPKRKSSNQLDETQPPPNRELLNIALSLASDSIANVRLNFGRVACSLVSVLDDEEFGLWIKAVQEQIETEKSFACGGDRDVLFFAKRALLRAKEKDDISLSSIHGGS